MRLLQYSTAGSIDTSTGVTGANVISFVPINNVTVDGTSNLPLGSFQVAALPVGTTTTYNDTPFSITFVPESYTLNGNSMPDPSPITVTGTLTGIENGPYQSSVVATFNTPSSGSIDLAGVSSTLAIPGSPADLVPSSAGGDHDHSRCPRHPWRNSRSSGTGTQHRRDLSERGRWYRIATVRPVSPPAQTGLTNRDRHDSMIPARPSVRKRRGFFVSKSVSSLLHLAEATDQRIRGTIMGQFGFVLAL